MIINVDGYFFLDADKMPESPVIMEVGAYTLHAAKPLLNRYPKAKMFIVEAHPDYCRELKAVAEKLGITIINRALAPKNETTSLYEFKDGRDASSVFRRSDESIVLNRKITVDGERLSSILEGAGIKTLDYLMLNCEGAEIFALDEILESVDLRNRVRQIGVSFHCNHVAIYATSKKDSLLKELENHYTITPGNINLGYYLLVRNQ